MRAESGGSVKKKPPLALAKKKADKLWSDIIHEKYNHRCAFCGETFALAAHHIRSRRFASTRWEVLNGILLCRKEHFLSHSDPEAFRRLLVDLHGVKLVNYLWKKSQVIAKVTMPYMEDVLKELEREC